MVLISKVVQSQVPGYMGKRFTLNYGFYFSPAITGSNAKGHTISGRNKSKSESGYFALNTQHQLGIEYVLADHTSIGFAATYYKTKFDNSFPMGSEYNFPTGNYDIRGLNYSLYFKFFRKSALAPYGQYFLLGTTLNTTTSTYDPDLMKAEVTFNAYYPDGTSFGETTQTYKRLDISLGIGKSRILYNRIVLDYGVNLQLIGLINGLIGPESFEITNFGETIGTKKYTMPSNYIERTSKIRNREVNKFNVFLKVGVLLF